MQSALNLVADRRAFLLVALSVLLAVWGEWALYTQQILLDGVLLFAAAAALFVPLVLSGERLVRASGAAEDPARQSAGRRLSFSKAALAGSVACALLAWGFSSGNRFRLETLVFWVLAIALYLRAFWVSPVARAPSLLQRRKDLFQRGLTVPWSAVGLGAVVLLAAFFRYYQLGSVPAEMTSDHAEKLLDVRDVLSGQRPIFFPRNTGREPLHFYLLMPFTAWLGLTFLALKVAAAAVSLMTVPVVYLIGREIAGSRFGLVAAFFLAVSKWDVGIARVGLRVPHLPLFTALSLFFLLRALRHGRPNDYLLWGLVTGLGFYGYSPFRAMVLLIPAAVLVKIAFEYKHGWDRVLPVLRNGAAALGATAMALIPLAHYAAENPQMFLFRVLTRVSSLEAPLPPNPLAVLLGNAVNGLLMFNWRGDTVWVNTVPLDPVLDYVSGGLFVLGIVWCLHSLIWHREQVAAYLLLALLVMMLPSVLSISFPNENPSVFRTGGNTPVVALLVAVPVYLAAKRMAELWPATAGRWIVAGGLALLLTLVVRANFDRYFVDYAVQYRQSARNSSEIAAVIDGYARSLGSRDSAYLKSWPHWVDTRNVAFNMGSPDWNNVLMTPEDILRHTPPSGNKLYIMNKDDKEAVQRLQQRYPEGQLREQPSVSPGQQFLVFFVPGRP